MPEKGETIWNSGAGVLVCSRTGMQFTKFFRLLFTYQLCSSFHDTGFFFYLTTLMHTYENIRLAIDLDMKTYAWLLIWICFNATAQQFAIIHDKDGFVNVRQTASVGKNITDTLANDRPVFCFEKEGNWVNVFYVKKGKMQAGYIHQDRIVYLSTFDSIPLVKQSAALAVFQKANRTITIATGKFDSSKSKLTYKKSENSRFLSQIDGKRIWGTDGDVPKRKYLSIQIQNGNEPFVLPNRYLQNLFEPNLHTTNVYVDPKTQTFYIAAWNSDGAGGYVVLWVIKGHQVTEYQVLNPF